MNRTGSLRPRILFIVTLGLGLVGCSNNPNPPEWNEDGTWYGALAADLTNLDPNVSYTATDGVISDLIYPSYLHFNYLKAAPWSVEPNIGLTEPVRVPFKGVTHTDKGDIPFEGERWDFELRHDLMFQDDPCFPVGKGRPVTAKDMEYSFKRDDNPKVEFPLEGNLSDKVLGWKEYRKGFEKNGNANYDQPFEGFKTYPENPYKFSILCNQKYPQLKYIMAMHFTTPVPREAVEKYGDGFKLFHPVGCGPYKLQEYSPRDKIVLVPNENCTMATYPGTWGPGVPEEARQDAGKKLSRHRIVVKIIVEPVTSYSLFNQGYLDTTSVGTTNSHFMLPATKPGSDMTKRGITIQYGAYPSIDYCGFNMEDNVFGGYKLEKKQLRQAIALSIDSKAYIETVYHGMGNPSEFIIPPGLAGYDKGYQNPYRQYDPSLKKAKELLTEAGYPNGVSKKTGERLVLNFDTYVESPIDRARSRLMTKQISALGIQVVTRDTTYPTFVDKTNHKKIQFFYWGWVADYPDAENFCMLMFSQNVSPGPNNTVYNNPAYDKLFLQMQAMDDGPQRNEIVKKMRDLSVEDCPIIYLSENQFPTVFQPWVKNKFANPILNDVLEYRAVDSKRRQALQNEWNAPSYGLLIATLVIVVVGAIPAFQTVQRRRGRTVRKPAGGEKD